MTQEIQELRAQADQEIEDVVFEINALAEEISNANGKIIRAEATT